jgi:hypothetical protein
LMHAMREEAHALGMVFSVSDPHWKELNDTGCCCGMRPDDPFWGAWERKQACNALVEARQAYEAGGERLVHVGDVLPAWAKTTPARNLVCTTGPPGALAQMMSWEDWHVRHLWNDPKSPRGPMLYFGGVLQPAGKDANDDLVYRYVPSERRGKAFGWAV